MDEVRMGKRLDERFQAVRTNSIREECRRPKRLHWLSPGCNNLTDSLLWCLQDLFPVAVPRDCCGIAAAPFKMQHCPGVLRPVTGFSCGGSVGLGDRGLGSSPKSRKAREQGRRHRQLNGRYGVGLLSYLLNATGGEK